MWIATVESTMGTNSHARLGLGWAHESIPRPEARVSCGVPATTFVAVRVSSPADFANPKSRTFTPVRHPEGEPLTEAALQAALTGTREMPAGAGKRARTEAERKAANDEQALPNRKPDLTKPWAWEVQGEGIRFYLRFPDGGTWGVPRWHTNVVGRYPIVDAWDGPRLDVEQAKSLAIAEYWNSHLDDLRRRRVHAGEEGTNTVRRVQSQAAAILPPSGRPAVLGTLTVNGVERQYPELPKIDREAGGDPGKDVFNAFRLVSPREPIPNRKR
jgi:hypothetical protein